MMMWILKGNDGPILEIKETLVIKQVDGKVICSTENSFIYEDLKDEFAHITCSIDFNGIL